jgi:hypothetical protein
MVVALDAVRRNFRRLAAMTAVGCAPVVKGDG